MIGIYCYTNKLNGKQYVGQSIDIEQRRRQHEKDFKNEKSAFHDAILKYGIENFIFSILEECSAQELDEKENFWITKLNTYYGGYNCNMGGKQHSIGEQNPRTAFTDVEVLNIRKRIHIQNENIHLVYEDFKDRISYDRFWSMAHGDTWKNVDCSMIKPLLNNQGSNNPRAKLQDTDVINIRYRKYILGEGTKTIYEDYKERISFSAFEKIALGSTWKHIPIPKKEK